MNQLEAKSVVVGVDGLKAALNVAKWAVDEAVSRQLPVRLVYVAARGEMGVASGSTSGWDLECGETALCQAGVAMQELSEAS